jgi:hypothetical protein
MKKMPVVVFDEEDFWGYSVTGYREPLFPLSSAVKLLNPGFGRNGLKKLLREKGMILQNGEPSERMVNQGYMVNLRKAFHGDNREEMAWPVCVFTLKGLCYIQKRLELELDGPSHPKERKDDSGDSAEDQAAPQEQ